MVLQLIKNKIFKKRAIRVAKERFGNEVLYSFKLFQPTITTTKYKEYICVLPNDEYNTVRFVNDGNKIIRVNRDRGTIKDL